MSIKETAYSTPLTKLDAPPENPEDPENPENPEVVITNADLKGVWSGQYGETYTFDGEGGCTVDFTILGGQVYDYTYTLDETTGKAVATYTGGTQNWTFTKDSGKITMSVTETTYSTELTK